MSLDWWWSAGLIFAAVGQTLFTLLYMTYPWYRTFLGRALFIKALTLMLLLDVVVMIHFGWYRHNATLVVMLGLTAVGIWGQFTAFLVQHFNLNHSERSKESGRNYHHGT